MRKITEIEVLTNKNLLAKTVAVDFSKKLDELLSGYIATNESAANTEIAKEVASVLSTKATALNELFMGPGSSFSDTIKKQGVGADAEKEKKEKEKKEKDEAEKKELDAKKKEEESKK
jgi:hypothetical protein